LEGRAAGAARHVAVHIYMGQQSGSFWETNGGESHFPGGGSGVRRGGTPPNKA